MPKFRTTIGTKKWNDAIEDADAEQLALMEMAENWAFSLERCDPFKRGVPIQNGQDVVARVFKKVWDSKNHGIFMEACAQILIDHHWKYATTLVIVLELNKPQRRSA